MALGGFVNGSGVILWALICPLGALLFDKPLYALRWFLAFLSLVILSGFLQLNVPVANNLSLGLVILFFVVNFIGVSSLVFLMVFCFIAQKNLGMVHSEQNSTFTK